MITYVDKFFNIDENFYVTANIDNYYITIVVHDNTINCDFKKFKFKSYDGVEEEFEKHKEKIYNYLEKFDDIICNKHNYLGKVFLYKNLFYLFCMDKNTNFIILYNIHNEEYIYRIDDIFNIITNDDLEIFLTAENMTIDDNILIK